MSKRTLLLDGDIFAYQFAILAEQAVNWGDGLWTLHAYEDEARGKMLQYIDDINTNLEGHALIVALSDKESGRQNFRNDIFPTYKANRIDARLPMILMYLRQVLQDEFQCVIKPHLEGDDVLGILATHPANRNEDTVIVSIDKDMKTIPCRLANTKKIAALMVNKDISSWSEGIITIDEEEADLWHLGQALSGDVVDGYPGCPGVGEVRAHVRLLRREIMTRELHTPNRGKNKGVEIERWVPVIHKGASMWDVVVSNYEANGLTEIDALVQAQCARILRFEDWDIKKQEVKLWTP